MVTINITECGIANIRLPERATAEELLRHQALLEKLAPELQHLDRAIQRLRQSEMLADPRILKVFGRSLRKRGRRATTTPIRSMKSSGTTT
jgi:hypothetical protein